MKKRSTYPRVRLTQPLESKIALGHPWLYADAISHRGVDASAGDIVDVYNRQNEWVGRGVFDPDSPIRVRIWTRHKDVEVNEELLATRVRAAKKRRRFQEHLTTGVRVLHGEGDRVPGLVCDRYGDVGVLRPDGIAAERWLEPAKEILSRLYPIEHWVIRRADIHRGDRPRAVWDGSPSQQGDTVSFLEHGMSMICDVIQGQKTGFFLDQRANRQRLARYCTGKRLLNLFGYTGGFSLASAMAGASRTTTVDLAAPAIDMAMEMFSRNHLPVQAHEFIVADVFDYLDSHGQALLPFDVIVCDPPSFAHKRRDVDRAFASYRRLFGNLLSKTPTGAIVALASCSSHINRQMFLGLVAQSAQDAGVELVIVGVHGADEDHPILPGFPEGEYLECVFATVTRD